MKRSFDQIYLNIRGIKAGAILEEWEKNKPRLLLPESIVKEATLVHKKKYGSIFVEPGVAQRITFFCKIPTNMDIVSIRADFQYSKLKSHSTERLFKVGVNAQQSA